MTSENKGDKEKKLKNEQQDSEEKKTTQGAKPGEPANENNSDETAVEPETAAADAETAEVTLDEAMAHKLTELNDSYLRLYADFDNFKKRAAKERSEASAYAVGGILTKLLPVLDNFSRALETQTEDKAFYDGVKMVAKQLDDILSADGLTPIEAVGKQFDPNFHNAVMTGCEENKEDNEITAELQRGYTYKDKVLRPSMVKVNKI